MLRFFAGAAALLLFAGVAVAQTQPNDPMWSRQYGPQMLNAAEAWTVSTGRNVVIAVIDSGVDTGHPDLAAKLVAGYDFGDDNADANDDSEVRDGAGRPVKGHGTAAAGVAAAITNNAIGMAGMAPDAKIMPIKVFGSSGIFGVANVPRAIRFAVDNGAQVINLSLGTFNGISLVGVIETPCFEAYQRGSLCVISSGNGGNTGSGYPRDLHGVLVSAVDRDRQPASFAQRADTQWGVTAPGVGIDTTTTSDQGSYTNVNGTSFSAPHVAGVAALLFAQGLRIDQVVDRLLTTATPLADAGRSGAGLVNAAAAVGATVADNPTSPSGPGGGGSTGPSGPPPPSGGGDSAPSGGGGSSGGSDPPADGGSAELEAGDVDDDFAAGFESGEGSDGEELDAATAASDREGLEFGWVGFWQVVAATLVLLVGWPALTGTLRYRRRAS